jgi:CheY-like chemotaxis protein
MMPDLFKPYRQASVKNYHNLKGSGLGLSIVKRIIDLFHGDISVSSQIGKGSCFVVRIPIDEHSEVINKDFGMNTASPELDRTDTNDGTIIADNDSTDLYAIPEKIFEYMVEKELQHLERCPLIISPPVSQRASRSDVNDLPIELETIRTDEIKKNYSILVVDDSDVNRLILIRQLRTILTTSSMDEADDGQKAIDKVYSGKHYDFIFMDIFMPNVDGYAASKRIREVDRRAVIIAATANSILGSENENMRREAGINDALGKPFTRDMIVQLLRRHGVSLNS